MADKKNQPDNYIASSESMRDFLNLNGQPDEQVEDAEETEAVTLTDEPMKLGDIPPDLPFLENIEEPAKDVEASLQPAPQEPKGAAGPLEQILGPAQEKGNEAYAFVLWAVKSVLPYIVIFIIGLGLYFFYFSDFSFTNWFSDSSITLEKVTGDSENKDLKKLKAEQEELYLKWMAQFFFSVNDEAIISMDTDVSGNGLSNFEKYLLDLNPKVYSTRGTTKPDGELVTEGINPWTGKPFTDKQKELVEKYLNRELISNRITAAALNRGVTKFAQYVNPGSPYYVDPQELANAQSQNQTITPPQVATNQTPNQTPPQTPPSSTTPSNMNPGTDLNLNIPGRLDIPANNITVPITWTKDVKDFDRDLKNGVVHYPGTALPGQMGTSYISGHSSGYLWDNSPYKQIFAILGQVQDGTSFTVTATQNDGKQVRYHYVVAGRNEYAANDQEQFVNTGESIMALSTCWPVGTTARRLVLFGKLTQTEY